MHQVNGGELEPHAASNIIKGDGKVQLLEWGDMVYYIPHKECFCTKNGARNQDALDLYQQQDLSVHILQLSSGTW